MVDVASPPVEVPPPPSPRKYWTRRRIAEWMRRTDLEGKLAEYFKPGLTSEERTVASIEGWLLGVR